MLEQGVLGGLAQLRQRSLDRVARSDDEGIGGGRRLAWRTFTCEVCALLSGQRLAARVRQEPVETSSQVPQVEPGRRGSAGPCPQLRWREPRRSPLYVVACLQERMGNGLQHWRYAGDGPAKPVLGFGHGVRCAMCAPERMRRSEPRATSNWQSLAPPGAAQQRAAYATDLNAGPECRPS